MNNFKKITLLLLFCTSVSQAQRDLLDLTPKTTFKIVALLEQKYTDILAKKLEKKELIQELKKLKTTINHTAYYISIPDRQIESELFLMMLFSIIGLSDAHKIVKLLNEKKSILFIKYTTGNYIEFGVRGVSAALCFIVNAAIIYKYYKKRTLTSDFLTEEEVKNICQKLKNLDYKISDELEKLNAA